MSGLWLAATAETQRGTSDTSRAGQTYLLCLLDCFVTPRPPRLAQSRASTPRHHRPPTSTAADGGAGIGVRRSGGRSGGAAWRTAIAGRLRRTARAGMRQHDQSGSRWIWGHSPKQKNTTATGLAVTTRDQRPYPSIGGEGEPAGVRSLRAALVVAMSSPHRPHLELLGAGGPRNGFEHTVGKQGAWDLGQTASVRTRHTHTHLQPRSRVVACATPSTLAGWACAPVRDVWVLPRSAPLLRPRSVPTAHPRRHGSVWALHAILTVGRAKRALFLLRPIGLRTWSARCPTVRPNLSTTRWLAIRRWRTQLRQSLVGVLQASAMAQPEALDATMNDAETTTVAVVCMPLVSCRRRRNL